MVDCLERLQVVQRRFHAALLIGCPDPTWPERLMDVADHVAVIDPGPHFASAATGRCVVEDDLDPRPDAYDLCVALGTLDTVNDLPRALLSIRASMKPDALLIGVLPGGESVPKLRRAMHAADQAVGAASAHVHPRVGAASLAALLSQCGFVDPVVDVDRVRASYESFDQLVSDLRRMAATNVLLDRSRRPLPRYAIGAARNAFRSAGDGTRTVETFELLHFAAWTAAVP